MLQIFRAKQQLMLLVFRAQQTAYFDLKLTSWAIFLNYTGLARKHEVCMILYTVVDHIYEKDYYMSRYL